ncbi:hypothetical protein [Blastococcus mobilis]|uniref:Uncharacterized protein n=1 Tax=Blastococcus mobilis TaxID=1938746 RepID=A0A238VMX7_9ACTN|nr:hypothetical protein [Blastococcus mobilis]SNR35715.1 hypothetical protein SAMN06272737_1047 [Blastococcus mobilis]
MGTRRTRRDRLDAILEAPAVDYAGATILVGLVLVLAQKLSGFDVLGHLDDAQRADLYGRLIGPLSIVASIGTAGLAVYAGNAGPTMTLLRATFGGRVLKQFRGAAAAAGLGVLILIAVYVAQVGYDADWTRWIALGAAAFLMLRTLRVIYFYSHVLKIVDEDKVPLPPRPSLDDLPIVQRRRKSSV